jgi:hypothetical protein
LEDAKSKDEEISSLKKELSSKASLGDKEAELQQVRFYYRDYIARYIIDIFDWITIQLGVCHVVISPAFLSQMTSTVTELKENLRKTDEDAKSKDVKISSLEEDVSKVCTHI